MANSSIMANFPFPLVCTQPFPKHHVLNPLTDINHGTLIQFTLTLPSEIAPWLGDSNMPSFLLTAPNATIGHLVSSLSNMRTSLLPLWPSEKWRALLLKNFAAIVMRRCLAVQFGHSSMSITLLLLQVLRGVSPQMAWLNPTGKSWCTCREHI